MSIEIDLGGQGALVTGSGAGIGREIARWLARAGAAVIVHDVREDKARAVLDEIETEGGTAFAVIADARDDDALAAMVAASAELLAGVGVGLDVAVNNVGNFADQLPGPFMTLGGDHWRDLVNQNLIVTALAGAAQARIMTAAGHGLIVNVSSGETTRPSPGMSAYGASKAAINHLTQTMAVELGPLGVRVIGIAPGTTVTEKIAPIYDAERMAAIVESTPLRRMTEHDELARLVVFLASDLARCITGQLILADAGAHLSRSRPPNRSAAADSS